MPTLKMALPSLACVVAFAISGSAATQDYPARPITMVVPFPSGGPTDVIARILADGMRIALGQPIIIENVTGASGSIGVGRVARATPDGYALSFGTWSTHVVNGAALALPYDVLNDFEAVGLIVRSPLLITSRKTLPARDLPELVAWLKANPDKATQGTPGIAGASHLAGILFQKITGTRFQFVPYRGVGPATQDMIAGRIDLMIDLVANSLPHVRAGSIKAYAVLAKDRVSAVGDIPTVDEAGVPGLHVSSWQAIWAPKGTPESIVNKLNKAVVDALGSPTVRKRLTELAQEIPPLNEQTPGALAKLHKAEVDKWWPVIREAGIKIE